uniref:Uncharacterized protein n=1 Tax=Oryza sativa subsp. indica TaxID=39946 RepID=A0A8F2VW56_ORYSI|nr:hypothetical protein Xa7_IRBB7.43 [Oryza sativa Indica Group]
MFFDLAATDRGGEGLPVRGSARQRKNKSGLWALPFQVSAEAKCVRRFPWIYFCNGATGRIGTATDRRDTEGKPWGMCNGFLRCVSSFPVATRITVESVCG